MLAVWLGVGSHNASAQTVYEKDQRLQQAVVLDGSAKTLRQALEDLAQQVRLPFAADPALEMEPVVITVRNRPAVEVMAAVAHAGRLRWTRKGKGYHLQPASQVSRPPAKLRRKIELAKEETLQKAISWPPRLLKRPGADRPQSTPQEGYGPQSFGAGLASAAHDSGANVVAVSQTLSKSMPLPLLRRAPGVRAVDLLTAVAERDWGQWSRLDETYVLQPVPELLALRSLSTDQKMRAMTPAGDAVLRGLTEQQWARLKAGRTIPVAELTPQQRASFRSLIILHHSFVPAFDRSLLDNPSGWHLRGGKTGVIFGLQAGAGADIMERDWPR